jgi:hypothetical protein
MSETVDTAWIVAGGEAETKARHLASQTSRPHQSPGPAHIETRWKTAGLRSASGWRPGNRHLPGADCEAAMSRQTERGLDWFGGSFFPAQRAGTPDERITYAGLGVKISKKSRQARAISERRCLTIESGDRFCLATRAHGLSARAQADEMSSFVVPYLESFYVVVPANPGGSSDHHQGSPSDIRRLVEG